MLHFPFIFAYPPPHFQYNLFCSTPNIYMFFFPVVQIFHWCSILTLYLFRSLLSHSLSVRFAKCLSPTCCLQNPYPLPYSIYLTSLRKKASVVTDSDFKHIFPETGAQTCHVVVEIHPSPLKTMNPTISPSYRCWTSSVWTFVYDQWINRQTY